jgi:hypothetical protein
VSPESINQANVVVCTNCTEKVLPPYTEHRCKVRAIPCRRCGLTASEHHPFDGGKTAA